MNNRIRPTYKRQRFLLEFINQLPDNGIQMTNLQKLVFLQMMDHYNSAYDFVPYKYGPYSFQLAIDVDILCRDGFLRYDNARIYSNETHQLGIYFSGIKERGDALIRKVYNLYPYYAINSEIVDRIFPIVETQKFTEEKRKLQKKGELLFTIGYEGRSVEAFINELIQNDIHLLCDVRRNPLSRKFGFSKSKLEHIIKNVGIEYCHIPELGIESEKRVSLNSIQDYELLFQEYAATLPQKCKYINMIKEFLKEKERVALMCYEKEAYMCHRHVIRDYLVKEYEVRSTDL